MWTHALRRHRWRRALVAPLIALFLCVQFAAQVHHCHVKDLSVAGAISSHVLHAKAETPATPNSDEPDHDSDREPTSGAADCALCRVASRDDDVLLPAPVHCEPDVTEAVAPRPRLDEPSESPTPAAAHPRGPPCLA
jgi:hypothetical protein